MDADEPARTRLAVAWPLFGLRLCTEHLVLLLLTDDDLRALMGLARAGIHPSGEMPFGVAWSILPSAAFERGYLAYHWANRSSWSAGDRELGLAASLDGVLIGMQGMDARQFATMRGAVPGPVRGLTELDLSTPTGRLSTTLRGVAGCAADSARGGRVDRPRVAPIAGPGRCGMRCASGAASDGPVCTGRTHRRRKARRASSMRHSVPRSPLDA